MANRNKSRGTGAVRTGPQWQDVQDELESQGALMPDPVGVLAELDRRGLAEDVPGNTKIEKLERIQERQQSKSALFYAHNSGFRFARAPEQESSVSTLGRITGGIVRSMATTTEANVRNVGEMLQAPMVRGVADAMREGVQEMQRTPLATESDSWVDHALLGAAELGGQILSNVAMGSVGAPVGMTGATTSASFMGSIGRLEYERARDKAIQAGLPEDQAETRGLIAAGLNSAIELAQIRMLGKFVTRAAGAGGARRAVNQTLQRMGVSGSKATRLTGQALQGLQRYGAYVAGEASQEGLQEVISELASTPELSHVNLDDLVRTFAKEFVQSGMSFAILGGLGRGVSKATGLDQQQTSEQAVADLMDAMTKAEAAGTAQEGADEVLDAAAGVIEQNPDLVADEADVEDIEDVGVEDVADVGVAEEAEPTSESAVSQDEYQQALEVARRELQAEETTPDAPVTRKTQQEAPAETSSEAEAPTKPRVRATVTRKKPKKSKQRLRTTINPRQEAPAETSPEAEAPRDQPVRRDTQQELLPQDTDETKSQQQEAEPVEAEELPATGQMSYKELQAEAKRRGVKAGGSKQLLAKRVRAAREGKELERDESTAERIKRGRQRNLLAEDVVSQWEKESGLSREDWREMLSDAAVGSGEQYGVAPDFRFGGKIPAEITDYFGGKLPVRYRKLFKANRPGGRGEETLSAMGAEDMIQLADAILGGEIEQTRQALGKAEQWARDTQNLPMLTKILKYRSLQGGDETQAETVQVESLSVGDVFTVGGEEFEVVQDNDGSLTVQDGTSGEAFDDQELVIDKGSLRKGEGSRTEDDVQVEPIGDTDLFGQPVRGKPLTGKQRDMGIDPGEATPEHAVGETPITDRLRTEAVRQVVAAPFGMETPEDLYLAIQAEYKDDAGELFNDPQNPMPEVREAWNRATKGNPLFDTPPETEQMQPRRIISEDAYQKAKKNLNDTRLYGGLFPVDKFGSLFVVGAYHIENGARRFTEWSEAMIQELGEVVRPHLNKLWRDLRSYRKNLDKVERRIEKDREATARPRAVGKRVKSQGRIDGGEPVTITPRDLLRMVMKRLQIDTARAYMQAARDIVAQHTDLAQYAKDTLPKKGITPGMRNRLLRTIAKARTRSQQRRAIATIEMVAAEARKRRVIAKVKKMWQNMQKTRMRPEFIRQMNDLMAGLTDTSPTKKTVKKAQDLLAAASDQEGIPISHIKAAREAIAASQRDNLRNLSIDDLQQVLNGLLNIAHQNATKNRLLAERKQRDAVEAETQTARDIQTRHGSKFQQDSKDEPAPTRQRFFRRLLNLTQQSFETIAYRLTGQDSIGYRILFENLYEGMARQTEISRQAYDVMQAAMADAGLTFEDLKNWSSMRGWGGRKADMVTLELEDGTVRMSRATHARLLWHLKDPSTKQQLLRKDSKGLSYGRERRGRTFRITVSDLSEIRNQATPAEIRMVDAIHNFANTTLRDAINTASVDLFGYEIATRTDHSPRRRDHEPGDPNKAMQQWLDTSLKDMGIFKPRTGGSSPIILDDLFADFSGHVSKVAAFYGRQAAAFDAMRLIQGRTFLNQVRASFKDSDGVIDRLKTSIQEYQTVANQRDLAPDKFGRWLVRKFNLGALGLKPHVVMYQTISALNATAEIEMQYMLDGATVGAKNSFRDELAKRSQHYWSRVHSSVHNILTPGSAAFAAAEMFGGRGQSLSETALQPIGWADHAVIRTIYGAAYQEGKAQGLEGEDLWQYTVRRGDMVVVRTQPSWDILTTSGLHQWSRRNPWGKILATMFSSQRNKNYNMMIKALSDRTAKGHKTSMARFLYTMSLPTIVNAMAVTAIGMGWQNFLRWVAGDLPEEDETRTQDFIVTAVDRLMGNWLIWGDLLSGVQRGTLEAMREGSTYNLYYRPNIYDATIRDGIAAGAGIVLGIKQASEGQRYAQGKRKGESKAFYTIVDSSIRLSRSAGYVAGIPIAGLEQMARPFYRKAMNQPSRDYVLQQAYLIGASGDDPDDIERRSNRIRILRELGMSDDEILEAATQEARARAKDTNGRVRPATLRRRQRRIRRALQEQ